MHTSNVTTLPGTSLTATALMSSLRNEKQVAQLSQKDRAAGWVSYGQSGRLELGDNIYGQYRSIFNYCDVFGQERKGVAK